MTKFIFNLDCLLPEGSILNSIAAKYNVEADIEELYKAGNDGNIPYIESLIGYIYILGKFPIDESSEIVANIPVYQEILEFIKEHKQDCVIATEYPSCWAEKLIDKIGCPYYASDVQLDGNTIKKLTYILKKENIVERYKNNKDKIVYIGCDNNDMEAMRLADVSISSGVGKKPAKSILTITNYLTFTEGALCRQLNQLS